MCFSQCTASCGGGVQTRSVQCLSGGRPALGCFVHQKPEASLACNTHFCPIAKNKGECCEPLGLTLACWRALSSFWSHFLEILRKLGCCWLERPRVQFLSLIYLFSFHPLSHETVLISHTSLDMTSMVVNFKCSFKKA